MRTKKEVKSCGKLYWAGEYAILSPHQGAIIKNIPIYMRAKIEPASDYQLASSLFKHQASLAFDPAYALIQEAIQLMNVYLTQQGLSPEPFKLEILGAMEKEGKKLGLGSSGSVLILTLRAVASFYNLELEPDILFKLGAYLLLKRGDNGSMGDLACIAYEDLIYYQSFDRQSLREKIKQASFDEVLRADWGYQIRRIHPALTFDFLVGWTKEPAISKDLIDQVQEAISPSFLSASQQAVLKAEQALIKGDKPALKAALTENATCLASLHPAIGHPKLEKLMEASRNLDALAKSSGAGGGDCGIALAFDDQASQTLLELWQDADIDLIYRERMGQHD
ncbi:phosphomevalonate kinase [Streptococcus oricebi]|uniref:phosphomevalonate kinase n=1 Tax=Streptococcus oricebi TaxID=1547447 RepID=A0ABS5B5I1_9STRE|nr:phosphomevalonate kinase [Streptococcus oricebi]MBP2623741.1 phosphomevalonate kinase [Streptococcus oricebi]